MINRLRSFQSNFNFRQTCQTTLVSHPENFNWQPEGSVYSLKLIFSEEKKIHYSYISCNYQLYQREKKIFLFLSFYCCLHFKFNLMSLLWWNTWTGTTSIKAVLTGGINHLFRATETWLAPVFFSTLFYPSCLCVLCLSRELLTDV